MLRASKRNFAATLTLLIFVVMGCSERSAEVSGVVKLDGKLLKIKDAQRGVVVFRPVAGGANGTSLINADGAYRIATGSSNNVIPGEYMVSVRVMELVPSEDGEGESGRPITPALYSNPMTSGLVFSIGSGENKIDLSLDSSAGPAVIEPVKPLTEVEDEMAAEESDSAADSVTESGSATKEPASETPASETQSNVSDEKVESKPTSELQEKSEPLSQGENKAEAGIDDPAELSTEATNGEK